MPLFDIYRDEVAHEWPRKTPPVKAKVEGRNGWDAIERVASELGIEPKELCAVDYMGEELKKKKRKRRRKSE